MDFSHKDEKYYVALLLLGAAIGYVSTLAGGRELLVVAGIIAAILIGYKSETPKHALLLGAFFGVVMVAASSALVQGHGTDWQGDIFAKTFAPFFFDAFIAALAGGIVAFVAHSFVYKKSR